MTLKLARRFLLAMALAMFSMEFIQGAELPDTSEPIIGRIWINRKNVFETGSPLDNRFPYSWANHLHIVTSENYIRRELLFKEGQPLDWERIRESERLLRSRPVFRYVKITPQETLNGTTDILIETEDVWSTTIQLAYSAAGGKNFYTLGFLEHNILGSGKSLGAFVRKDIDRFIRGASYEDTQFLGSRLTFFSGYGRDEKGRDWEARLEKPFYSVLVNHAEGGSVWVHQDEARLFENGDEKALFDQKSREIRMFAAAALNPSHVRVRRVTLAHEQRIDAFSNIRTQIPLALPEERRISAALVGFDYKDIRYRKMRGVRTFDRDEDINVGWEWTAEAGPSLEDFGATRDGAVAQLQVKKTVNRDANHLWFNHLDGKSRFENGEIQNGILRIRSHYFLIGSQRINTFHIRGEWAASHNLDPERQFLLGGENGLRGYSVRQFSGQNKMLFSVENRRVIQYDWLNLVSLGWALFADSGAAWNKQKDLHWSDIKSDVGAGIRFAPSRSFDPGLIRLDVAYALQNNEKNSRFVINIGADISFGERRTRKFDQ